MRALGLTVQLALAAGLGLAGFGSAWAQAPRLEPSAALECATHVDGQGSRPVYPALSLERRDGGQVTVEMRFSEAARAPSVRVLGDRAVHDELVDTAVAHARGARVPCLPAGEMATLRRTYVFDPFNDERQVVARPLTDPAEASRRRQLKCLVHRDGSLQPDYPEASLRRGEQGNVLVRLRFTARDTSPAVEVLASDASRGLTGHIESHAKGLRLPCLEDAELRMSQLFHFRLEGGPRTVLRDMDLLRMLRLATVPLPARFNLDRMGCPFDLRLTYYQPYLPNAVSELGSSMPEREEFLLWLERATLRVPERQNIAVLGQSIALSVPCGRIDL
jgi:hypothetical protein